ncbi:hypothetical protein [Cytophaga hutchinsonii]|uniref:Tetratricopeptide repeat protein n=1 Tax=Cytophaga hutchinsonii (strain ATCC 33406 / DSM 1761 / CIP 103989 / NBRC 15051 / NCIMB 9469 / D465) TaxID=269798 RepID=A0A6N4SUK7_CYTH3|nr:hypothetical protein [Cytophaga hutchinsonii]ABG60081.1 conserved hypothetical protein [Cytophaga hutchinsonii ATCC 33406]SFX24527.1 hypothetical protein SAMN04487930_102222 [Cytophaga hutchinsonii ATCC 33406]
MKRLLLFILILLSNSRSIFACGFYPYGEEVRFSMYSPDFPLLKEFQLFIYSSDSFRSYSEKNIDTTAFDENVILWRKTYKNIISLESVHEAVYKLEKKDFQSSSPNSFVRLLIQTKDTAAMSYLFFAKKCSGLNEKISDPWERNEYAVIPVRNKLMQEALRRSTTNIRDDLKKRYLFLAMRLAYYNTQHDAVRKIYEGNFAGQKERDIIDYWSMYFYCLTEKDPVKVNYYAAQVFAFAPDKRFMAQQQYNDSVQVSDVIKLAENKQEQAAVWLLAAVRNPYKCLPYLKKIYAVDPSSKALVFLLLREVNKLEDWIYTPYYTEFTPSISAYNSEENEFDAVYKERIRKDRLYANEVYAFTKQISAAKVYYPAVWESIQVYLNIMNLDYRRALTDVEALLKQKQTDPFVTDRLNMLKTFCEVAVQPKGNALLSAFSKAELMKQYTQSNYKFIFAVSKELEFRNNAPDAAALLSTVNLSEITEQEDGWRKTIFWRTRKGSYMVYGDFYNDYFDYLDFQYTPDQVKSVIARVKQEKGTDAYSAWAYKRLHKDLDLLYDLTGTKYMRKNNLQAALQYFEKVNDSIWENERYRYLDSNPFYTDFYTEHEGSVGDTITYTKPQLVKTLLTYLKRANDPANKDRDYYYFLAGNCYLNMTCYGNSWMMKRYTLSSSTYNRTGYNDRDFIQPEYAKQYYLKAKQYSKTKKFAALCLRMAGRCEKYNLQVLYEQKKRYDASRSYEDQIFKANKYYRQLKKEYPDDYDELLSNCESFTPYFAARR